MRCLDQVWAEVQEQLYEINAVESIGSDYLTSNRHPEGETYCRDSGSRPKVVR